MHDMTGNIRCAIGLFALLPLAGCLVTSSNKVEESGIRVSENTLANVEVGRTSGDWLVATLGEPTSRTVVADRPGVEIWRYEHVRTERSAGAVFLIFGGSSSKTESSRVFFELEHGVVRRTWSEV